MPLTDPVRLPLVSLLSDAADPHRLVAFGPGGDGPCSHARLLADISALSSALADDRGRRWLLETEDAYRIAVSLLAAAVVGARVALPPNLQPGTLAELGARCDRVFVDAASPSAAIDGAARRAGVADVLDPLAPGRGAATSGGPVSGDRIDRHAPLVDLFTSGTSGPGKLVTKALCHLEDEVVELERMFGCDFERGATTAATVLATVPAHHLYGLLFRVLWPLAAARPFHRASFLLPDDLLARVAETSGAIVVSSPAHLRHLAASPRLAEHAAAIRAIFSSGGPLETATALELEAVTGRAPLEIFGSTETGGVASRRATTAEPSPHWSVFAAVSIEVSGDDQRLRVTSPFVTPPAATSDVEDAARSEAPPRRSPKPVEAFSGAPQSWTMGDRVERDGDGFRLLGRGDRIVKIGEKTLSLPEIEASLSAHDDVEAAVVGTYASRSAQRLGAIVVLSAAGKRRLAEQGRRAMQALLAAHLAQRWDRVALPRRWRFRDALPVDSRGKITREAFEAELARAAGEPVEPLLLSHVRDGNDEVFELVVPRDLAYLDGHYEAFPLVPGVVQIHWVMSAIGRIVGHGVSAQRMEAVKFKNVLRPAQAFTMRLGFEGQANDVVRVSFTLAHEARVFSSGRITLAA